MLFANTIIFSPAVEPIETKLEKLGQEKLILRVAGTERINIGDSGVKFTANSINISGDVNSSNTVSLVWVNTQTWSSSNTINITSGISIGNISTPGNVATPQIKVAGVDYRGQLWSHINTTVVSGVTLFSLTNLNYKALRIYLCGMTMGNTRNTFFTVRLGTNAAAPINSTTYQYHASGGIVSGNNMGYSFPPANVAPAWLLIDRTRNYNNAVSNLTTSGGFDGMITISPLISAEKTKVTGHYVYGTENPSDSPEFAAFDGFQSTQAAMNSIWIAANTSSAVVPTFSGTIIVEGLV